MVEHPGVRVLVEPADSWAWSAAEPLAERAAQFARRFCEAASIAQPFRVTVAPPPRAHVGLGTGTQLGLAVCRAIAGAVGLPPRSSAEVAALIGRGRRSAIGVHGFEQGGLLVDGGKAPASAVAPLVARHDFPAAWPVVLALPPGLTGTHGPAEGDAFGALARQPADPGHTDAMCRLVLLGLLPALVDRDFDGFSEALYDYNRHAGELFRPWQGDVYSHPRVGKIVKSIRSAGVKGVGQTSWGPAVFAVVRSGEQAMGLCDWLYRRLHFRPEDVIATRASNRGAVVSA
jgi:beta-RFAP synthase